MIAIKTCNENACTQELTTISKCGRRRKVEVGWMGGDEQGKSRCFETSGQAGSDDLPVETDAPTSCIACIILDIGCKKNESTLYTLGVSKLLVTGFHAEHVPCSPRSKWNLGHCLVFSNRHFHSKHVDPWHRQFKLNFISSSTI